MMTIKEYINSKAGEYKQYVLDDLKANMELANIVNSVFFPVEHKIEKWLGETEVKSFYDYKFNGDPFFARMCTRDEIDNIPSLKEDSASFSRYRVFSYVKLDSYEEVIKKTPTYYHFVREDFFKIIDTIVFDNLKGYKRKNSKSHRYIKKISDQVDLTLSTEREYIELTGLIGYTFPSLSIVIKNEDHISFNTIDVRSLLFMPESSFLFFYSDCHNYTIDENSRSIKNVKRKDDEPVIYYLKEEQKYVLTNSWKNIDRYNKYIQIVLGLSFHYLDVFEKWLTQLLVDHSTFRKV